MKDYSKMSDKEINKEAERLTGMYCIDMDGRYMPTCDYCNNPSDAWTVIHENRISLRPDDMYEEAPHSGYWRADNEAGNHCHHEKTLRAAMIVYLMMKDEEQ